MTDFAMGLHQDGRKNTNESVGLNLGVAGD